MKAAVAFLEAHMEKTEGERRAKPNSCRHAVKGDVHDIGKKSMLILSSTIMVL